jgi:hypothetical protein
MYTHNFWVIIHGHIVSPTYEYYHVTQYYTGGCSFFLIGQILLKTETLARRKEAVKKKTKMPHIHVTSTPKTHKTAQTKDQKMAPTTLLTKMKQKSVSNGFEIQK